MSKRVTHLTVGLGKGGAETMLYQVLKHRTDMSIQYRVISLGAAHYYEKPIRQLGIDVIEVPFRKKPIPSLWRIFRTLRNTDTLCCWMYHANLIGYYLGRLAGVKRIVWNIRHSNLDPDLNSKLTLKINHWCARRSKNVSLVAYNGEQARKVHEEIGYCSGKGMVLNNGCDCEEFKPDADARFSLREELAIPEEKQIVLSVTKNHPIKDIPTFIRAFALLHRGLPNTVAVMCGSGVNGDSMEIAALCHEYDLQIGEDIFLLGMRHDVPRLMAGCDLYVLHSAGEAFPNTLIQAMACGCLCVATDVGDVRRILGENSFVVQPCVPEKLYKTMMLAITVSDEKKAVLKSENRKAVMQFFDIRGIAEHYERLF